MAADGPLLPNLIIGGVHKAATSSLFWYLSQHPEVCPADLKELSFFTRAEQVSPRDEYMAHFRHCGTQRYRLEASPEYFYGGPSLVSRLAAMLPDPRIIISLRDPVDRFLSWYRFNKSRGRLAEHDSLGSFLARCEQLRAEGMDTVDENRWFSGLSSGFYSDYMGNWFDVFGEDLRVVFFEDVVGAPNWTVAELCRWLNIDPGVSEGFTYTVENQTVQYRSRRLQRLVIAVNARNRAWFNRHRGFKRTLRRVYYTLNGRDGGPAGTAGDAEARERLTEIYAPANRHLAELLRVRGYRHLPGWLAL